MNTAIAWVKASRLPAQTFIFPSLLLGQAIGFSINRNFSWSIFGLVHMYGIFMHLFIVYGNDYSDYETDKLNKTYTPFTGGSRVLVEQDLDKQSLLFGAVLMAILSLIVGAYLSYMLSNWSISLLVVGGILLLHSYSFKPMKISYKGFGELLQMIGVGLVLPLIGYLAQGGAIEKFPFFIMAIILPSQLAMAISTSLPDEPSDKLSSKRTTVVILGQSKSKFLIVLLYSISLISILLYQKLMYMSLYEIVFALTVLLLISLQLFLSVKYSTKPGSSFLFYLVLISILTNTTIVLGMAYMFFIPASI